MLDSSMIDIAIGLSLLYLMLSLLCSSFNEIIEAFLKRRAVDLEQGIRETLHDLAGTGLAKGVYDHPLVNSLFRGAYDNTKLKGADGKRRYPNGSQLPTYIPARNFALALMDVLLPGAAGAPSGAAGAAASPAVAAAAGVAVAPGEAAAPAPLQRLRTAVADHANQQVKQALLALIDAAGDDASKARENIEGWYNSSMDRVSGWYKRRTQVTIFFLGLVLAAAINADTIAIASKLASDKAVRNSLAGIAQQYVAKQKESRLAEPPPVDKRLRETMHEIEDITATSGLRLGWNLQRQSPVTTSQSPYPTWTAIGQWSLKAAGWLLTALAISLGAPFWFDLLNKFMVVRSTVKPHEKSPESKAGDRD